MSKRRKNSNYHQDTPQSAPQQTERSATPLKRTLLKAVRWSAWMVLFCVIITQFAEKPLEDGLAFGMFIVAGLLYAISVVLERKYKW